MTYIPNPWIIPVGVAVGLAVSAPVGPVNILCIQRALHRGVAGGIAAGLGAVIGDGLIAFAAAMGIGAITSMVTYYRTLIEAIGGIVLVVFGVLLVQTRTPVPDALAETGPGRMADYVGDIPKTFLMTVTNPAAVLGLFAIFSGIGTFVEVQGAIDAVVLVGAIMAGSLIWWVMLSTIVALISGRFGQPDIGLLNLVAGAALMLFGFVLLSEVGWRLGGRDIILHIGRLAGLV